MHMQPCTWSTSTGLARGYSFGMKTGCGIRNGTREQQSGEWGKEKMTLRMVEVAEVALIVLMTMTALLDSINHSSMPGTGC